MVAATKTLAIDIGGSHLKAMLFDLQGETLGARQRVDTPSPSSPSIIMKVLVELAALLPGYERVSVGFPGSVRDGIIKTAPNLGTAEWAGFDLRRAIEDKLGAPTRVLNDASVQGYGAVAGQGLECIMTLGTGMGFAIFLDGNLAPHLELGQHLARKDMIYDQYVGNAALKKIGRAKWARRVERAICQIETLVDYDALFIGGGNAKYLESPVSAKVHLVDNKAGLVGGWRLWAEQKC